MFDALRFLNDHHIETWTTGKNTQPGWINVRCPLCHDTSNHGGFNVAGGYYNCWKCGGSTTAWVVSKLAGISYPEALREIERYSGYVERQPERDESRVPFELPGGEIDDRHVRYLQSRGFDPYEIVKKYGILGTEKFGPLAHRIVIPIFYNGRVVSWQARTIADADPKYKACPNRMARIKTKEILYNLDNCPRRRAMVVEGVTDVWRLGDDTCSVFGVGYTMQQLLLLHERFDEITIIFDTDVDAQIRAEKLAHELNDLGIYVDLYVLDDGKDPGGLDQHEVEKIRSDLEL